MTPVCKKTNIFGVNDFLQMWWFFVIYSHRWNGRLQSIRKRNSTIAKPEEAIVIQVVLVKFHQLDNGIKNTKLELNGSNSRPGQR